MYGIFPHIYPNVGTYTSIMNPTVDGSEVRDVFETLYHHEVNYLSLNWFFRSISEPSTGMVASTPSSWWLNQPI